MAREIVTSENRDSFMKKKLGIEEENPSKVYLEDEDNISHIFHNGKKVGQIEHQSKDNMTQILRSDIEKEHQNKGIGSEAYKQFIDRALQSGKSIGSDSILTEHGEGLWKKLHKHYDVKKSENAKWIHPGRHTTLSKEDRERLRPKAKDYDSSYLSGHEPVYQIHPKKHKKD